MGLSETISIQPGAVTLAQLRRIARDRVGIELAPECRKIVDQGHATIARILASGETVYGVNTGFGKLAQIKISADKLMESQRNLIMSHCVGTGDLLDDGTVRLILVLKLLSLSRGYSGVRWEVVEALIRMLDADVLPCNPSKGSVGASGDLAPLAHMAAALIGLGEVRHRGRTISAEAGLSLAEVAPLVLGPKEGLALINGAQVSTALALEGLFAAEDLFTAALVTGAISVDAAMGSDSPFDPRIHDIQSHEGQRAVAAVYRNLLHGSDIRNSHLTCDRVQDPYSLRCQPQVMGACLDHLRFAADIFQRESNGVSDNPIVFSASDEVLSGGNFHAEYVAMASDVLALALAEIGALAERRVALLIDSNQSGLPPFLIEDTGVNSGFMMAQVTAAALASENKSLAHPASVDSLPTSANQEDHVSMATFAARRLGEMADNTAGILAVELLAATQGIEFHAPLRSSDTIMDVVSLVRAQVLRLTEDRILAPDLAAMKALILSVELNRFVDGAIVPSLKP